MVAFKRITLTFVVEAKDEPDAAHLLHEALDVIHLDTPVYSSNIKTTNARKPEDYFWLDELKND